MLYLWDTILDTNVSEYLRSLLILAHQQQKLKIFVSNIVKTRLETEYSKESLSFLTIIKQEARSLFISKQKHKFTISLALC